MLRGHVCRASVVVLLTLSLIAAAARHTCAASLDQMQQSRFLRICANPAALPYSNTSARNGPPGFQLELGEAIAREMGLRLVVVWSSALNAGRSMECDASLDAIAQAEHYEREGVTGPLMRSVDLPVRYTKPYAAGGVFLAVPSGSRARHFEDLANQKIGVLSGSSEHEFLAKKGLNVSVFPFPDEIVYAIDSGEIGAGALTAPLVGWFRHEHPNTRVVIPEGYQPEPALRWNLSIALWHADDALLGAVNAALDRVIEQQIPDRIYAKYGVAYHPPFRDP